MSDRIDLHYRKKCETCDGDGFVWNYIDDDGHSFIDNGIREREPCPDCTEGYTDEVLTFEDDSVNSTEIGFKYLRDDGKLKLVIKQNLSIEIWDENGEPVNLNPTHLEVIEVKECPECVEPYGHGNGFMFDLERCTNCNPEGKLSHTGKIEVVTQFTVFESKEKYDEAIYKKAEARYRTYKCYDCHDEFKIDSNRMGEILDKDYTICKSCLKKKEELKESE